MLRRGSRSSSDSASLKRHGHVLPQGAPSLFGRLVRQDFLATGRTWTGTMMATLRDTGCGGLLKEKWCQPRSRLVSSILPQAAKPYKESFPPGIGTRPNIKGEPNHPGAAVRLCSESPPAEDEASNATLPEASRFHFDQGSRRYQLSLPKSQRQSIRAFTSPLQ